MKAETKDEIFDVVKEILLDSELDHIEAMSLATYAAERIEKIIDAEKTNLIMRAAGG